MKTNAKVILLCGKIAAGKTFYANRLRTESGRPTVILSCDEIMLAVFPDGTGEMHDTYSLRVREYLFRKSPEILETGCDVILDWGFWRKSDRDAARSFYRERGIPVELHVVDTPDELWKKNIGRRNRAVAEGTVSAYFVDEGLLNKLNGLFEPPCADEVDVWYKNTEIQ